MAIDYSELLDTVCAKAGLEYISDLKYISPMPDKLKLLAESLEDIDASAYPIEQWNNLCAYMFNDRRAFLNQYDSKRFILDCLRKIELSI